MNEAKNTAIENKVSSIENTPSKSNIRSDISGQGMQLAKVNKLTNLTVVSLPAEQYFFEKALQARLANNFGYLETIPSVKFHCAEKEKTILKKGILHRPDDCTISCMTIEKLLSNSIYFNKAGFGRINKFKGEMINNYNLLWADYCKHPDKKSIDEIIKIASHNQMKNALYYVTYSLCRTEYLAIIKKLKGNATKGIQVAIENYILNRFQKYCNKKAKLVYSVIYMGGVNSTMITVGIHIGNKRIDIVKEDRRENKSLKAKNKSLYNSAKNAKRVWFIQPRKEITAKKSYGKSNLTLKDREAISITYQACKKIGISRKGMSRMIVDKKAFAKRKISVQQISAVISWLDSPKLRAKTVN